MTTFRLPGKVPVEPSEKTGIYDLSNREPRLIGEQSPVSERYRYLATAQGRVPMIDDVIVRPNGKKAWYAAQCSHTTQAEQEYILEHMLTAPGMVIGGKGFTVIPSKRSQEYLEELAMMSEGDKVALPMIRHYIDGRTLGWWEACKQWYWIHRPCMADMHRLSGIEGDNSTNLSYTIVGIIEAVRGCFCRNGLRRLWLGARRFLGKLWRRGDKDKQKMRLLDQTEIDLCLKRRSSDNTSKVRPVLNEANSKAEVVPSSKVK